MGLDPRPFTLRQLLEMFTAHQRDAWDHTAQILAAWSSQAIDPRDLNPYRERERRRRSIAPAELHAVSAAIARRNARQESPTITE